MLNTIVSKALLGVGRRGLVRGPLSSIATTSSSYQQMKLRFFTSKPVNTSASAASISTPATTPDVSSPTTAAAPMSPDSYRKHHNISLLDSSDGQLSKDLVALYDPIQSFDHKLISPKLASMFLQSGFTTPTSIQSQTWPIVMQGKDVIAVARTGSGKTYGYLLPTIQNAFINVPVVDKAAAAAAAAAAATSPSKDTMRRKTRRAPKIMIVAPTRELSMQIMQETLKFTRPLRLNSDVFYGGVSKVNQISSLSQGVDIIIGTPGRIFDLIEMGNLDTREISHLILDEADRMLDMGFEPQIRDIVDTLPANRQTVCYTATWPKEVVALSRQYLKDPVRIVIGDQDKLNANKNITQHVIVMKPFEKREKLIDILVKLSEHTSESKVESDSSKPSRGASGAGGVKRKAIPKTLIFVSTKVACDDITDFLNSEGFATKALHGGMSQASRESIVHQFRRGYANIVVATDVASRGLDIKDIEIVVNYDFPSDGVESYVHRIGRTGRGDNKGHSVTFVTQSDMSEAQELIELLKRSNQDVPGSLQSLADQYFEQRSPKPRFSRYGARPEGRGGGNSRGGGGGDRFGGRGGGRGGEGGDRFGGRGGGGGGDRDSREGRFSQDRRRDNFGGRDRGDRGDRGDFDRGGATRGRGRSFELHEESGDEGDRRSNRNSNSSRFSR